MTYTKQARAINNFDSISISIASPEDIRRWSYGPIDKADTINYRTLKPEPGGLFNCRTFGPVKDYECYCGKYKKPKHKGTVCEKCGVEVTVSSVRRERMGHIELAANVAHVWFMRSAKPAPKIPTVLDLPLKNLEKVLHLDSYIVIDSGAAPLEYGQLLNEADLEKYRNLYGEDSFVAGIGAEAIREMLKRLDLTDEAQKLRAELSTVSSDIKRKKIVRRLRILEQFIESKQKPEWMILEVLPVHPPDLRPMVPLDGGRFATSDINDLYRKVINRNNRLKKLIETKAPEIIIQNEKRMLQAAVDNLFENTDQSTTTAGGQKRQTKSLANFLKGKQGRFRQNLLGKRVDYSGRSVIVVGSELELHQCGIPKKMALELFKPFVYHGLDKRSPTSALRHFKKMIEAEKPEVWDVLEEVIREHPVLLNRAPTLHRLGIQAFEPVLIEGKAIQLHPLVCEAFNADFDGDQMAVHVPISVEARTEARVLMMSTNNILSPQDGRPVIVPTQDIVLGLYYLTMESKDDIGEGGIFSGIEEVEHALAADKLSLHARIKCMRNKINPDGSIKKVVYNTTAGRVILSEVLPKSTYTPFDIINKQLNKKEMAKLIETVYRYCGHKETVVFADQVMRLGFLYSTLAGFSIGKDDMIVPQSKRELIEEAEKQTRVCENDLIEGAITEPEKYNKIVDIWTRYTEKIGTDAMLGIAKEPIAKDGKRGCENVNSIYIFFVSGARGSAAQINQLLGMRGLMTTTSGKILEKPIKENFLEGISPLSFFISTHGARKGLADMALKTANSGYLTRKLVDVSQDCVVVEENCGTNSGIIAQALIEGGDVIVELGQMILGRVAANNIHHPSTNQLVVEAGQMIDEEIVEKINEIGMDTIKIRSVITCETKIEGRPGGVCAKCYGRDLSNGGMVNIGEPVGIVAAQSIGEPGTQLTMRTFHIGGVATRSTAQSNVTTSYEGKVEIKYRNIVVNSQNKKIVMSRNCEIIIKGLKGEEKAKYKVPYGAKLFTDHDETVSMGQKLAEWDPFTIPIITEKSGTAVFVDLINGVSLREATDESTGIVNQIVVDWRQQAKGTDLRPRIVLHDHEGNIITLANGLEARYMLPAGVILAVQNGQKVNAGDIVARIPKEASKTRDITGGLPRVIELFEARKPKALSVIAEKDGYIEFGKDYKNKRRVIIRPTDNTEPVEYLIQRGKHIVVNEGDYVLKGDVLMDGIPSPHDILRVMGVEALNKYMTNEIQQVYRLQGVQIDNKHIEVVLRQMLKKVEVIDPGQTTLLIGQQVSMPELERENAKAIERGGIPAIAIPVLLSITKASLNTDSFLSAASFQETTRVLTEAAIEGKIDKLRSMKEAIIVGSLIPAGTGLYVQNAKVEAALRDKLTVEQKNNANASADLNEQDAKAKDVLNNEFDMQQNVVN